MTAIVHLTEDDYSDALLLLSFDTLTSDGFEIVVDLDEDEALQLRESGRVETVCARGGQDLVLLAPDYEPTGNSAAGPAGS